MSEVDNLNFKLIIDEKAFQRQIDSALKMAKGLNTDLSRILDLRKNISKEQAQSATNEQRMQQESLKTAKLKAQVTKAETQANNEKIRGEHLQRNLNNATGEQVKKQKEVTQEAEKMQGALRKTKGLIGELTNLTGVVFGAAGIRSFVSSLVKITGEFEVQKKALGAILQDGDKAAKIFDEYRKMALESPYTFQDFTKYGKQLTSFSIPAENLLDTTKMLADVAAGLGVDMQRIILAYGQIKSAGVLKGTELRQLTEAGVPILKELSKQLEETTGRAVSFSEVYSMISKKQIPFEMVEKAFKDMTSEGGKFYNMQEVLVETLQGKIGKLRDVWQQALYDMGQSTEGMLKGSVDMIIRLVQNMEKLIPVLGGAAAGWVAYKAAITLATGAEIIGNIGRAVLQAKNLSAAIKSVAVAAGGAKAALGGLVGILTAVGITIGQSVIQARALDKELDKIVNEKAIGAEEMVRDFERLKNQLQGATKGSREYKDAIHELNAKYGEYLPNLLTENNALIEITKNANSAADAIRNKARAEAEEAGKKEIENSYRDDLKNSTTKIRSLARNLLNKKLISDAQVEDFTKKVVELMNKQVEEGARDVSYGFLKKAAKEYFSEIEKDAKDKLFKRGFRNSEVDALPTNALQDFHKELSTVKQETADFLLLVDGMNGGTYSSDEHARMAKEIEERYKTERAEIEKIVDAKERSVALEELEKKRILETANMWDQLNNPAKAKELRDFLEKVVEVTTHLSDITRELNEYQKQRDDLVEEAKKNGWTESDLKRIQEIDRAMEALRGQQQLINGVSQGISKNDTSSEQAIRKQIELFKDYKEAYQEMSKVVGSDLAKGLMSQFFKGVDFKDYDFDRMIEEELTRLESLGTDSAIQMAESLRASFSNWREGMKPIEEAADAVERFRDSVDSLSKENTDIEGTGFWYKMSKVASDLQTKLNDLALKGKKAKEILAKVNPSDENQKDAAINALVDNGMTREQAEDFWRIWVVEGDKAVDGLIDNLSRKAETKAAESARSLAKTFFDEFAKNNNIDLTNLSRKPRAELQKFKKELDNLAKIFDEDITFSNSDNIVLRAFGLENGPNKGVDLDKVFAEIKKFGPGLTPAQEMLLKFKQAADGTAYSFKDFGEAVKTAIAKGKESLSEAEKQQLVKTLNYAEQAVQKLTGALTELGEALDNPNLASIGESVGEVTGAWGEMAEAFISGDPIKAVSSVVEFIVGGIIKEEIALAKLRAAIAEASRESRNLKFDQMLSADAESIFGESGVAKMENAVKAISSIKKEMASLGNSVKKNGYLVRSANRGTEYYDNLVEMLRARAKEIGRDFLDQYGNYNAETLQAILDTYTDLGKKEKAWINQAIDDSNNYAKAIEQLEGVLSDVMGDLAGSAADTIVDKWKEAGEAALDYADILDEVATRYAKMLVESMLMDQVFNEDFENNLKKVFSGGDVETAMAMVAEKMEEVTQLAPEIAAILAPLQQYIKNTGESTNTLSEGISKELIERNSTLLASYINGIRADVAVTRQDIHAYLPLIAERMAVGGTTPSLALYQQEVNAHLANIEAYNASLAENMADFLTRFKGMIGAASTGGSALRVMK